MTRHNKYSICTECGGNVINRPVTDTYKQTYFYNRWEFELPLNFLVPVCIQCNEAFFDENTDAMAIESIKPAYLSDQKNHMEALLKIIRKHSNVSLLEISKACDTNHLEFYNALVGLQVNPILSGLLESFAIYPEELRRRLSRQSAHDISSVTSSIDGKIMTKVKFKLKTSGDGFWTNKSKLVQITKIVDTKDSLRVYFDEASWNIKKDGLIYTDPLFLSLLKEKLIDIKFKFSYLDYSENGLQGDNYVHFDFKR